jgi:hypothetical protein
VKQVAKGQIQADNSYKYTCGTCGGRGFLLDSRRGDELCVHCYNGDYARITEEMKTARGQRYYGLLKSALKVSGKAIAEKAQALRAEHDGLTMAMLGYMTHHFNLNFKALGEWLEECRIIPTGTTERISESNYISPDGSKQRFKVKYALEKGEKWYNETYGKEWDIWRAA